MSFSLYKDLSWGTNTLTTKKPQKQNRPGRQHRLDSIYNHLQIGLQIKDVCSSIPTPIQPSTPLHVLEASAREQSSERERETERIEPNQQVCRSVTHHCDTCVLRSRDDATQLPGGCKTFYCVHGTPRRELGTCRRITGLAESSRRSQRVLQVGRPWAEDVRSEIKGLGNLCEAVFTRGVIRDLSVAGCFDVFSVGVRFK